LRFISKETNMTTQETNGLRKVLESTALELHRSTRRRDGIFIEANADVVDRTQRSAERELAARGLEFESLRLQEARVALRRMDEGSYGICQECEGAISPRRLAAMPAAALCLKCQVEADAAFALAA
jgi:DnaK suppressor protein